MCAFMAALPASAQTVTVSRAPDAVGVTVYRDPNRPANRQPNLGWLNGYALITETRRVRMPAGEVDLRFEGVAGGIIPASAIVSGLPDGVAERNRDARLLSLGALVDASLGRRVTVRRTSPATGQAREVDAVVRSTADQGLVIETAEGAEALRCSGLPETVIFPQVPSDLSAKPTLAVRTTSTRAWSGEVTLSYLATGFDWTASYVATLAPEGDRMDLFAWVTLANGDETSFVRAETQAVAGKVERRDTPRDVGEAKPLILRCWPGGTTTDLGELAVSAISDEEIVVTGHRVSAPEMAMAPPPPPPPAPVAAMEAVQEELGDLKLYRIPEPVTVAARSQKQVAMLQRRAVPVDAFYRLGPAYPLVETRALPVVRAFRARNTTAGGLGLPLPDGRLAMFAAARDRNVLLGQGSLRDRAVGEEVEFDLGPATGVGAELTPLTQAPAGRRYRLTLTNDSPRAVDVEVPFVGAPSGLGRPIETRNGRPTTRTTVPANGTAVLEFSLPG